MPNIVEYYKYYKVTLHKGWIGGWSYTIEYGVQTWRGGDYATEQEAREAVISLIDSMMNPVEDDEYPDVTNGIDKWGSLS